MEVRTWSLERPSAAQRTEQAEKFERMAELFKTNPELNSRFSKLAEEVRQLGC